MTITATISNNATYNDITVATEGMQKTITIPAKPAGGGSSVNGGELLFLSLATCFCNDIYREAVQRAMIIHSVEVTVSGSFGAAGEAASAISYTAKIKSDSNEDEVQALVKHVDKIAEIHNTLRQGVQVTLKEA